MPFLTRFKKPQFSEDGQPVGGGLSAAGDPISDRYVPSTGIARKQASRALNRGGLEKTVCSNLECEGTWRTPWKNRHRPIFEEQWGCSLRCLQALIRTRVLRESNGSSSWRRDDQPHRHRVPLGLVMLSNQWITHEQLLKALEAQRASGTGRIGDWLRSECGLDAGHVTRGLSVQWSCPVLPMEGFIPSTMALTIPRLFAEEFGLLPLRVAGSEILYLALQDRLDAAAALALGHMSSLRVVSGLMDEAQFRRAHSLLLASSFVSASSIAVSSADDLIQRAAAILEQQQPLGARLVRMHQYYWLRIWREADAWSGVGSLPSNGQEVADTIFTISSLA